MIIRKKFSVESAHIVRNCTSDRCSHSIHGHSAVIEVAFEAKSLDNAQMVYDFGLMKGTIKEFIDSMDHCYLLCSHDNEEFQEFIKKNCKRWISLPFNPSAEMLSMFIFDNVQKILGKTIMNNGEQGVQVHSVRYWETTSGSAECNIDDIFNIYNPYMNVHKYEKIEYSQGVIDDWSKELTRIMVFGKMVDNPVVEQQIKL